MGAWRNANRNLDVKDIKRKQLVRPSCRWDDNIKKYDVNWTDLA
jgi:hypothetical protein